MAKKTKKEEEAPAAGGGGLDNHICRYDYTSDVFFRNHVQCQ